MPTQQGVAVPMNSESRNTNPDKQMSLLAQSPPGASGVDQAQGVGARQGSSLPAGRGGGSPLSCNALDAPLGAPAAPLAASQRDPRVEELRQIGLGAVWVRVADAIGYENFLTAWAVMSSNRDFMDGRNRTTIPDISLLYRYQRNQLVRGLASQGMNRRQIFNEVARLTGMALTDNQIEHITRDAH